MSSRRACGPDPGVLATESLGALLSAVARGQDGAFDVVHGRLSRLIYDRARAVLCNHALAEEVAQEVLLEIWQHAVRYDPARGTAVAWALMIARRRAIDELRSVSAAAARERRDGTAAISRECVSDIVERAADREQLRRCVNLLSGPQREAVLLVYYGGHTHAEVAGILGIPVGTAKTRIRSALTRLRIDLLTDSPLLIRGSGTAVTELILLTVSGSSWVKRT